MPLDLFVALVIFAFAMAISPGPNNFMLTASGVNFGFARTIPHMAGVTIGYLVVVAACGAGLGVAFTTVPALQLAMKIAGALYMLWLAWKVAKATPAGPEAADPLARPLTFLQAAAFQWVNPKGVLAALSAVALFMRPGHAVTDFALVTLVFGLSSLLSAAIWTALGVAFRRLLQNPVHARVFNGAVALLLVVSIVPMGDLRRACGPQRGILEKAPRQRLKRMFLTILAIPFILLGVFIRPYDSGAERCFNIELIGQGAFCFERASYMPEIVKYGCMVIGVLLIYAGRQQIRQSRRR